MSDPNFFMLRVKKNLVYVYGQCKVFFNPFPNKPWFLRVSSTSLLKTLREKEKLLVTSNFSFSYSVFYPFRKLSSILIKFKIVTSNFSFSHSVFYPFRKLSSISIKFKIVVCKLVHFGPV